MKNYDWSRIIKDVEQDDRNKVDYVTSTDTLEMVYENGCLEGENGQPFEVIPNEWCLGQLFSRLKMPIRYFRNLYDNQAYSLVAQHVNHHLPYQDTHWMIRAREAEVGNDIGRAVVSDRYSVFDNGDLIEILTTILNGQDDYGDIHIPVWTLNDRVLHLQIGFEKLTRNLGDTIHGERDDVRVGVHIANSEVGYSSIKIEPMVYRLVCGNCLIRWSSNDFCALNQRHIYLDPDEMYGRVAKALSNALEAGHETISTLQQAKKVKIPNPLEVINELAEKREYSDELTDTLRTSWSYEPDDTLYGVVNAFTRTARDLDAEKRVAVEKDAGQILEQIGA